MKPIQNATKPTNAPASSSDEQPVAETDSSLLSVFEFVCKNQDSVNRRMASEDWAAKAKSGEFDYYMAGLDEMAEYWRSVIMFKWWDQAPMDIKNGKMELVDAFHFIVSAEIAENGAEDAALNIANSLEQWLKRGDVKYGDKPMDASDAKNHMKSFTAELCMGKVNWGTFWHLVNDLNILAAGNHPHIGWQDIIALYRAKAVLNKFRTEQRALPGGYRKIWADGAEDNAVMMAWLETMPEYPGDDEVRQFLATTYARVQR